MTSPKLGRALAATVATAAVLNTLSALSMPVRARKPAVPLVLLWLALLCTHAAVYEFGDRIRERFGLRAYAVAQASLVFLVAVSSAPAPLTVGVFMVATAELVVLAGTQWGTIRLTLGAIALFVLAALITSDLYRASTAGVLLAITGMIAHAVAALVQRSRLPAVAVVTPDVRPTPTPRIAGLSPRELEVLRELVSGARNSDIAGKLGISERTVKAHLATIYQKLGVSSRSAAVAAAVQRHLV